MGRPTKTCVPRDQLFTEELLESVHTAFSQTLDEAGVGLDGLYFCPHVSDDACECRKPKPGMLLEAKAALGIDLEKSWMIGDTLSDLQAGWAAGTRGALVRTGFGEGTLQQESSGWARQPDLVADNVYRALCDIFWGQRA